VPSENPYKSPDLESRPAIDATPDRTNWRDYSDEYNSAFRTALIIQGTLAVLTALMLDFGQTHRAFWVAFLGQWLMVWLILFRRPRNPTRLDLAIVRFGIVPMLILVAGAGPWLLRLTGLQI
jgi:hypothetical protein